MTSDNIFTRFFSCKYMVKPKDIVGDIPTTKEAYKRAIDIAWPSMVEATLVSLVTSVDTMMVGTLGPEAIAAVGITSQPKFIIMALILSITVGMTAVVSRRKGEDDYIGANSCLKQGILLGIFFGIILSVVGIAFSDQFMILAGAGDDILKESSSYFRITMIGFTFTAVGLTINAAQRGVGNTRISMTTNLTANFINVIFNYLLINGIWIFPQLGINGAAIATVLGNIVSCFYSIHSVYTSKKALYLDLTSDAPWKFNKKTMKSIFSVSSSAMVEQVFMRVGLFAYAIIVAKLGTIEFATHQICMQILNLSYSVGDGIGIAVSSLVGQNLGSKRPDLSKMYVNICQRIALLVAIILFLLFFFGQYFLIGLFTTDKQVIQKGGILLIIIAFTTLVQTTQLVMTGCLRGAGDTKFIALFSFFSIALIRPILSWVLCFPIGLGLNGAWLGLFIDQLVRLIFSYYRFKKDKWTLIKL